MTSSGTTTRTIGAEARRSTAEDAVRYSESRDPRSAATLLAEDRAEDAGLDPFERVTCRIHPSVA